MLPVRPKSENRIYIPRVNYFLLTFFSIDNAVRFTMEWLSKIVDIIKIPIKYFWIIFLISLFLLFFPDSWLDYFKLLELRNSYHLYISLAFIVTLSLLSVESTLFIYRKLKTRFSLKTYKKNLLNNLTKLDPQEKSVIREFFLQNQNTLRLPYDEPIVSGLIKKTY